MTTYTAIWNRFIYSTEIKAHIFLWIYRKKFKISNTRQMIATSHQVARVLVNKEPST